MNQGMNKVMIMGRVDGDVDMRYAPNGRPVILFSVGAPRTWTSSEGKLREETEWFNVVAWGDLAELCHEQLMPAQRVYVEGRLQTRGWEDDDGRKHYRTELIAHEMIPLS